MSHLALDIRALDRARISRDPRFDGKFFIAVKTTGIYCRPICPSRTSHSRNVRYFATAAACNEAGYRPCLRCRPEAAPGTPAWMGTSAIVKRALRLIEDGILDHRSVEELASTLGVGPRHLHRLFLQHVGASPVALAQTRRLHFAKRLLDESSLSITEIALAAGFSSLRRFHSAFRQTYGRPPRELRRQLHAEGSELAGQDIVLRLAYRPPYDWKQVSSFLQARAIPGIERVDESGYWRTVSLPGAQAIVNVRPIEAEDALQLRVSGAAPAQLFHIASAAKRVFDVSADPARTALAFRSDPLLGSRVKACPGLRIPGAWDPFECAVRAVLGQQVSVAAGLTFVARLVQRTGEPLKSPVVGLNRLFPSAGAVARADLDGIGLTQARTAALRGLAVAVAEGKVDFHAPVDEVVAALSALPGIGDWTAQYVALRALGEPDAFPASDLVLRRVAGNGEGPLSAAALQQRAEAWRPWRGYAALHLWHASRGI